MPCLPVEYAQASWTHTHPISKSNLAATDIHWREHASGAQLPTRAQFYAMLEQKTGGLFRLAIAMLQRNSSSCSQVDFVPLANSLARFFQIRDDLVNLTAFVGKSRGDDISEGKISFPVLLALEAAPHDTQLLSILRQRTRDETLIAHAIAVITEKRALKSTSEYLSELYAQITTEISRLGGNTQLQTIVDALAEGVVSECTQAEK